MQKIYIIVLWIVLWTSLVLSAHAQDQGIRRIQNATGGFKGRNFNQGGGDSLKHRTGLEDSITISFRYLDSSRLQKLDTSIKDFTKRFPIPWYHIHLGNVGNPTHSLLFAPTLQPGWDHGFHAYDVYNFNLPQTRFFNTTRPYSELGYMLGSLQEQMIYLMYTQNIRPTWNFSFQYRLINSRGTFQNQNSNHNNYNFTSWYQSRKKRYQNFLVIIGNKLMSGDNGGIKKDGNYLDSTDYKDDRFKIPTQLGVNSLENRDFFKTIINTGTFYTNAHYLFRQQYDLGQKDSLVINDSTVVPLFYPRLRLEHTISYNTYKYRFKDIHADSIYYRENYDIEFPGISDTFYRRDWWKELINDFSIYQFPDAKNPQQFFKVGGTLQNLHGDFDTGLVKKTFYNFFVHGEYRNKSRNQKWDIESFGNFYVHGLNAGDYNAYLSLKRLISQTIGYLQLGGENVNRTPSFIFNGLSSFYLEQPKSLNKENITYLFGSIGQPQRSLQLSVHYYLLSNYTYLRNYYHVAQASVLFNLLQVVAEKEFRLARHWKWRTWVVLQQKTGNVEINLPLLVTRNQFAYDGTLGFKNLRMSTGLEIRYFSAYKADNYSPLQGQFFFQDTMQISMKFPEISAYLHFRIRSFTAYIRLENLNTLNISQGSFTSNNMVAPFYPSPGLQIRFGIFWSFVN